MSKDKAETIDRLVSNLAEVITEDELRERLNSGKQLTHYIGFEISGYVHIGQGIMSALVMKDLTDLGVKCTVWLADWHTWINDKLDGTKETAATIGQGYFTEAIKACFKAVGGDPDDIEFRLANDWYKRNTSDYMALTTRVTQNTTEARLRRSIDIMGKKMGDEVSIAQLMYPAMQVADVFLQEIDIVHAGTDQRKAYVIMRDVFNNMKPHMAREYAAKGKPVILLHHLLPNLFSADGKMSKSEPYSAVFIHDSAEEIEHKINKAYAPEKDVKNNPVLIWTRHLLFWNREGQPFRIEREEKHGGNVEFTSFTDFEKACATGEVHPMDLKAAVAKELIDLLAPVREHFAKPEITAKKAELDKVLQSK